MFYLGRRDILDASVDEINEDKIRSRTRLKRQRRPRQGPIIAGVRSSYENCESYAETRVHSAQYMPGCTAQSSVLACDSPPGRYRTIQACIFAEVLCTSQPHAARSILRGCWTSDCRQPTTSLRRPGVSNLNTHFCSAACCLDHRLLRYISLLPRGWALCWALSRYDAAVVRRPSLSTPST